MLSTIRVPIQFINTLSIAELYQLSILLIYINTNTQKCYPSIITLAHTHGGTFQQHNKIIKQLERKGVIRIIKHKSKYGFDNNEYEMLFDTSREFVIVPSAVLTLVKDKTISKATYVFYVRLLRFINYESKIISNITVPLLAKFAGTSHKTAYKQLNALKNANLIDYTHTTATLVTVKITAFNE